MSRLFHKLNTMSPWHFLWMGAIASELLIILSSLIASNLLWGKLSHEVVIIGIIDKAVVSVPVVFITVFFVIRIQQAQVVNGQLRQEIEQRKQLEAEREQLLVELGQKHKMESVGTMATGIAHEINQPLSYIKIVFESFLRDLEEDNYDLAEL
jgi:signal transduction histidine kinase